MQRPRLVSTLSLFCRAWPGGSEHGECSFAVAAAGRGDQDQDFTSENGAQDVPVPSSSAMSATPSASTPAKELSADRRGAVSTRDALRLAKRPRMGAPRASAEDDCSIAIANEASAMAHFGGDGAHGHETTRLATMDSYVRCAFACVPS